MTTTRKLLLPLVALLAAGCASDPSDPATSTSEAELSSNTHAAFDYFVSKGLTKRQSAGIVGNLMQESGVDPTIKQFGGGPGRGIAQWSVGGRWDTSSHDNVTWYAHQHGLNRWGLKAQLHFIWFELASVGGYGMSALRHSTTINGATIAFMKDYEICGACDATNRINFAHQVFNSYATSKQTVGCYSPTLGADVPDGTCVQSPDDSNVYTCEHGDWVDAATALVGCSEVQAIQ